MYKLIGTWPKRQGWATAPKTVHESTSLDELRELATNWSDAGAVCTIVQGVDVVEHFDAK